MTFVVSDQETPHNNINFYQPADLNGVSTSHFYQPTGF